jgi:hypothetical protein
MSRTFRALRYIGIVCLLSQTSVRADDSTATNSPESQTVGEAAEQARQMARNNRWRNTALALGVIGFGIVALIAVGNNGDQNQGCCESDSCCP